MRKTALRCSIFSVFILVSIVCCTNNKKDNFGNPPNIIYTMPQDTLKPEEFSFGGDAVSSFRIITLGDKFFSYRKPDYNGGFFIGLQTASATRKEHEKKVEFDKLKKINNYIIYCKEDISQRSGTWDIPQYNMYYIKIEPPLDICTFDLESYAGEWQPYLNMGMSPLPDPMMVLSRLNIYSSENPHETQQWEKYVGAVNTFREEALKMDTLDLDMIHQLRALGKYDTIMQTDRSILYINTDLEVYEQPLAKDIFYIIRKKYYPNGIMKEKFYFYPGVYTSHALPVFSFNYDENGEVYIKDFLMEYSFTGATTTIEYLLELMRREGNINPDTGEGKATMKINGWVDPRGIDQGNEERLSIRSKWQITADDDFKSSIGILIKHKDDSETVYLIDKPTRTILKRFKR